MKILLNLNFIFVIIYILVSFPSYSKWQKYSENEIFIEYIELDSLKKLDDIIYVWSMIDYKKPQKNGNLSTKYFTKYNCSYRKYVIISIIEYPVKMGKGRNFKYTKNLTNKLEKSHWFNPPKDSEENTKIKFMCAINKN